MRTAARCLLNCCVSDVLELHAVLLLDAHGEQLEPLPHVAAPAASAVERGVLRRPQLALVGTERPPLPRHLHDEAQQKVLLITGQQGCRAAVPFSAGRRPGAHPTAVPPDCP